MVIQISNNYLQEIKIPISTLINTGFKKKVGERTNFSAIKLIQVEPLVSHLMIVVSYVVQLTRIMNFKKGQMSWQMWSLVKQVTIFTATITIIIIWMANLTTPYILMMQMKD